MIATYAAVLAVCGASLLLGWAAFVLCGLRGWSWLAPSVGFALLCALCWATVRLPGEGVTAALALLALLVAAGAVVRSRLGEGAAALRVGAPAALAALAAASLPFLVEGHFGILGTGFNPDMSQHLLATDRLAEGQTSPLLRQGYPLGPHAVVAALHGGLGIGLVQAYSGFTAAIVVLGSLTALAAFADRPPVQRTAAAALLGAPYLVASYYAQGSFKEIGQALLVLAFVLALRECRRPDWREAPLRFVPAALLALGAVYVYSFPGLVWLGAAAAIWAALSWPAARASGRAALLAASVLAVGSLPELGRMLDFQSFETFDPDGPGLGNLFGQLSPLTALGVWPSGDFRVAPGDGAAPALIFYLGAAFAAVLLAIGLRRCWRRGEAAILAGVGAVALVYLAARLGGTAYTGAKALAIAAPPLTLAIISPLLDAPQRILRPMGQSILQPGRGVALYVAAAAACSLLALANAPVGPTSYSPALTGLRPLLAGGSTLVLAPDELLEEEHGARYLAWELRGGRVCIEPASRSGGSLPAGIRFVVTAGPPHEPPFPGLELRRRAGPYAVWERRAHPAGPGPCPQVAERQG